MKKLSWFVCFSLFAVSCLNEADCYQLNNNAVVIYFKILGGKADLFELYTIQSADAGGPFLVDTAVSYVALPINPKTEETVFTIIGAYADYELPVTYNRQVQFVSEDCGERYVFSNLNVLENNFDSVLLVSTTPAPVPVPSSAKNIEIYRCPRTNLAGITFKEKVLLSDVTVNFPAIIYQPTDSVTTINLPLNPNDTTTTFTFSFGNATKTLKVSYLKEPETLFQECGEQSLISKLYVNVTDLTLVNILNDSIEDLPIKNFEITP